MLDVSQKALVSTTLSDGMYYEVTFSESRQRAYIDAYKKWDHVTVEEGEIDWAPVQGSSP
jgi:hypothetical protein